MSDEKNQTIIDTIGGWFWIILIVVGFLALWSLVSGISTSTGGSNTPPSYPQNYEYDDREMDYFDYY